ncbi:MAG: hypothetical protein HKM89_12255 [Gemmatimonadales bacterium]|nr:hypothetical protein [Gemmatimonadales bacterium]
MRTQLLWISALVAPLVTLPAQTHLVVVAGLGGEARYRDSFHQWATELMDAATGRLEVPAGNIIYLAESTDRDPTRIQARSTKENLERVLGELAAGAATNAQVFIVLIGHGSARGGEPKLNLPGPDLTAEDLARLLEAFPTQTIVVVNFASASGDFIPALSGPRRIVITATKSGAERNQTRFGRFFVDAFAGDQSDVDHDGNVSLLEAFTYARREVVRTYEQQGILLTEHAMLDDNGDKEGSHEPDPATADGALARTITLGGGGAERAIRDPELTALYEKKRSIEQAIAELQRDKGQLESAVYERRLEEFLLDLAGTNRAIREREGGGSTP